VTAAEAVGLFPEPTSAETRHILIVTPDPDDPEGGYTYVVECPGVTDACRMWVECGYNHSDDDLYEDETAHGERHQMIGDIGWCVSTDACFIVGNDYLHDAAEGIAPGRWLVDHDYDDGQLDRLTVLGPATTSSDVGEAAP
jgi:hypothetical protein